MEVYSAKMNLASTYVNGFVNLGMGRDFLMGVGEGKETMGVG